MASPETNTRPSWDRVKHIMAGVLAVTRWGLLLFAFAFVVVLSWFLLPFLTDRATHPAVLYAAMGLMVLGVWANAWNAQCDFVAAVLCDGWVRAVTMALRLGAYGGYAREHSDALASYLAERRYRLVLFLLPHACSLVMVLVFAVSFATGGWPLE